MERSGIFLNSKETMRQRQGILTSRNNETERQGILTSKEIESNDQ